MTHDEMIAVIQAHKEGKKIQYCDYGQHIEWKDYGPTPSFNFYSFHYRIKPAEPKKVKLLAWLEHDTGYMNWRIESYGEPKHSNSVRIPSEDKEIEIPGE